MSGPHLETATTTRREFSQCWFVLANLPIRNRLTARCPDRGCRWRNRRRDLGTRGFQATFPSLLLRGYPHERGRPRARRFSAEHRSCHNEKARPSAAQAAGEESICSFFASLRRAIFEAS